jgi:hypothetical protein
MTAATLADLEQMSRRAQLQASPRECPDFAAMRALGVARDARVNVLHAYIVTADTGYSGTLTRYRCAVPGRDGAPVEFWCDLLTGHDVLVGRGSDD